MFFTLQDLRALLLIFSVQPPKVLDKMLYESLHYILSVCHEHQQQREEAAREQAGQRRRNSSQDSQGNESGKEETGRELDGNSFYRNDKN